MNADQRYCDGAKFVAWLESEGVRFEDLDPREKKLWRRWLNSGERADTFNETVDLLLLNRGLSAIWIPDDIWSSEQRSNKGRTGQSKNPGYKEVQRLLSNTGLTEAANILGVTRRTAQRWSEKPAKKPAKVKA